MPEKLPLISNRKKKERERERAKPENSQRERDRERDREREEAPGIPCYMETLLVLFITARPRGARLVHVGGGFSLSRRGRHRGLSAVSPTAWQTVLRMSDTAVTGSRIKSTLLQDTTHLIQRPCYQRRSPCQDPAGNRTTRRPPDDRKRDANCSGMVVFPVHQVWPKPSCKAQ